MPAESTLFAVTTPLKTPLFTIHTNAGAVLGSASRSSSSTILQIRKTRIDIEKIKKPGRKADSPGNDVAPATDAQQVE